MGEERSRTQSRKSRNLSGERNTETGFVDMRVVHHIALERQEIEAVDGAPHPVELQLDDSV